MPRKPVILTERQREVLIDTRDHNSRPYMRERASAILKVADGGSREEVGRSQLLRPHSGDTVGVWIRRFVAEGPEGLVIRPGRGRKPAFFPLKRGTGQTGTPRAGSPRPKHVRS